MSREEFRQHYLMTNPIKVENITRETIKLDPARSKALPTAFDWYPFEVSLIHLLGAKRVELPL